MKCRLYTKIIRWALINFLIGLFLNEISLGQSFNNVVYTNGVFVKDGKTTEVEKKLYEFLPTNSPEILYFSNDLLIKIYTNSDFLINSFFQEILNYNSVPHKTKFGASNFASTLVNGTAIVTYSGGDSNSSCIISTPMTDLELQKGTFYFKVNEGKVLVFVLDGSLISHGDRNRENVVTAGYAVIAVPNDIGVLEAKISLGAEKVRQEIINKLNVESKDVINLNGKVLFATINGKQVGIFIN